LDKGGRPTKLDGTVRDITERKRAEELARQQHTELAHVSRLSTMGEMASGMAHELNQPLSAIVNYTSGCVHRLRSGTTNTQELLEVIGQVGAQAEKAGEIIRRLRNFVRKVEPQCLPTDINEIVCEATRFIKAEATDHHVSLRVKQAKDLPTVYVDQIQIQQVLLNLLRNGIEAMDETNRDLRVLSVETSQTMEDALAVAVCDHGRGLTDEVAERVFDPFFTTKAEGMGMGLSISRSIIELHGGRLWAAPNQGDGATFTFTIPPSKHEGGRDAV
jgi:C4-dicarboxylate-specific signal transduction histidine kinase